MIIKIMKTTVKKLNIANESIIVNYTTLGLKIFSF